MFSGKGVIETLNSASHFALYVFDKLLETVNQMLTWKNGVGFAERRGGVVSSGGEAVTMNN